MNDKQISEIIAARYDNLRAMAIRNNRTVTRGEEALHQGLERAWAKRHTFQGETVAELYSWLRVIVLREIPENPTRRVVNPQMLSIEPWHEPATGFNECYMSRYFDEVMAAVEDASIEFQMQVIEGYKQREISEILGVKISTAGSRAKRDQDRIIEQFTC